MAKRSSSGQPSSDESHQPGPLAQGQSPDAFAASVHAPLYNARFEHDACGIGFLADLSGRDTHRILDDALKCLERLAHRGAFDADGKSGDGAGILCAIPHTLLNRELERVGQRAQRPGDMAVGMIFLPRKPEHNAAARAIIDAELERVGFPVVMWRTVPLEPNALGKRALEMCPDIQQVIIERPRAVASELEFDQALYLARRRMENAAQRSGIDGLHIASMSCRSVVYKALVSASQFRRFYLDLNDLDFKVNHCVFHQRYSTNTFPTWDKAQPFRFVAHNGEINTVEGNQTWMRSREPDLASPIWGAAIEDLKPIIDTSSSDTGRLDNAVELLTLAGRDVRHSLKMLIPPPWEKDPDLSPAVKNFFRFHSALMEPWDGPASIVFSDGYLVGLALDRNGLRPARYIKTRDGIVYAGSEVGALDVEPERIELSGKVGPGGMICADLGARKFWANDEILNTLARGNSYQDWCRSQRIRLEEAAHIVIAQPAVNSNALLKMQAQFGWTSEELTFVVKTMFEDATEPVGSMGDDTPHAVLSPKPRPLFNYFKQRFAEVTNPPIDHLREDQVMSLRVLVGPRGNILDERPEQTHLIRLNSPILTNEELKALVGIDAAAFRSKTLNATFEVPSGSHSSAMHGAVRRLCDEAGAAVCDGASLLVLSDRATSATRAVLPALLALGAVHHHLIRAGLRNRVSLIVESGEAREVHHMAVLLGFGASAVNPYLALDTAREAVQRGRVKDKTLSESDVVKRYVKAAEKGVLKVMSKMGIASVDAYIGAQLFEAVGLNQDVVDECFHHTPSRLGGIGYAEIEQTVLRWHHQAHAAPAADGGLSKLEHPGFYKERAGGEAHGYSQRAVHALQKAVRMPDIFEYSGERTLITGIARTTVRTFKLNGHFDEAYALYKEFSTPFFAPETPIEPRDLMAFSSDRAPIDVSLVEPVDRILVRFNSAAMSLGALSPEAHETLAIAMTRLGGQSNSGEGGEDADRFKDERNSGIKQIASGRFGVTPAYLMSAHELQIKMAQGSKPGEGGQIPGHKVTALIARLRHTVPGVALISPPPHHDIYSIEDLAQLIYDLKQINPDAKVSVKLVAQAGVGTIAAGVAKAMADVVVISGHSGGTGASPLSSIKNAGMPWELGVSETQQTLVNNNLRGRIRVRTDGGIRTGRDVLIGALLGAEEFSFGTAALIAEGCIMARVCHLNTCPTGVATQREDLRKKFDGKPEHVMAYLMFVAQETREQLAQLGYATMEELIGRSDLIVKRGDDATGNARLLNIRLLSVPPPADRPIRQIDEAPRHPRNALNEIIVEDARIAIDEQWPVRLHYSIKNQDRSIGARLAGEITKRTYDGGLPPGTIEVAFRGYAGQSFGAFTTNGMRLHLVGAANDYVGKGMRGGEISLRPFPEATYQWTDNHILGNTTLYGATGGALFAAGKAGERFAVRNSGACGVVEGVGEHACEYMTGGVVVVLGATGRNFAAGMTGGMAFVYDADGTFHNRCNLELVEIDRLTHPGMKKLVKSLLRRHYELTNSPRARELLMNWEEASQSFRRVLPKDRVAEIESVNEFSDFQVT